jgi:hypothetical protein
LIEAHAGLEGAALVIVIKTIAANGLTTTTRTGFQITTNVVERAASHATVVTLRELYIVIPTSIRHSLELPSVDDKIRGIYRWPLVAMPPRFFLVPGHIGWRLVKLATQG